MKYFLREIVISILISIILIFILSIIVSETSIQENVIIPSTIAITAFSLIIGGFRLSRTKKEKGILYGSILGATYMIILYIVSSFMNFEFNLSINSIIMIILGILGGAIGGILGVNFK